MKTATPKNHRTKRATSLFAASFCVHLCALVFFCFLTFSCGGGGGGGASGSGSVNQNHSLSVKLDGFSAAKNATGPNLLWESIDLYVYIDGAKNSFTLTPDNPSVTVEHVPVGAQAWAEADIHVQGMADLRHAKSQTITVSAGANKLTLFTEYTVTFNINTDDFALFSNGDDTVSTTYTKQSFKAPSVEPMEEYANHTIDYWFTDLAEPDTSRFIPGVTTGDITTLYAHWVEGPIIFTKAYYESGVTDFVVIDESQLIQLATLSNEYGKNFDGRTITITKNLSMTQEFSGIATGTTQFEGTFDGGGNTITLNISADTNKVALIGVNNGMVRGVITEGSVTGGINTGYTGGVVAYNGGEINRCANKATVSSNGGSGIDCGGICAKNTGTIIVCYNEGVLENRQRQGNFGGICGEDQGGYIENVYAIGNQIIPINTTAGGIIGKPDANTMLTNCYSKASNAGRRTAPTIGYHSNVTAANMVNVYTLEELQEQNNPYMLPLTISALNNTFLNLPDTPWVSGGSYPTFDF